MNNFPGGKPPDPQFLLIRFLLALASLPTRISSKKGLLCTLVDSLLLWHFETTTVQRYLAIAIYPLAISQLNFVGKLSLCRKILTFAPPPKTMLPRRHWCYMGGTEGMSYMGGTEGIGNTIIKFCHGVQNPSLKRR